MVNKEQADQAFDYAACIACGACVAACPNASASLFTAAKVAHLVGGWNGPGAGWACGVSMFACKGKGLGG